MWCSPACCHLNTLQALTASTTSWWWPSSTAPVPLLQNTSISLTYMQPCACFAAAVLIASGGATLVLAALTTLTHTLLLGCCAAAGVDREHNQPVVAIINFICHPVLHSPDLTQLILLLVWNH
jgi:hypothetical protein